MHPVLGSAPEVGERLLPHKEILQDYLTLLGKDRFRVELDTVNRV